MTGRMASAYLAFMKVQPGDDFDGLNEYYAIERESNQVVALDYDAAVEILLGTMDEESRSIEWDLLSYHVIQKMVLSPDGYYALVLTRDGVKAHLFMIRLETLECREVRGIDAKNIRLGGIAGYWPNIEWNGDKLIMSTEDGIGLFEFE